MGIRFQNTMYSDQGTQYRVNIWDSDFSSGAITTKQSNGFEIEYDRVDRFLTPLIPSSCYYTIYDDGQADMVAFKADLATAQEDEFKLYIERYEGGSWVIFWAGVIMADMVTWDNCETPRPLEIVAKCGLNRLSGIMFEKIYATPYSDQYQASIKKIIFDCLSYSATAQFWNGSSKPYIVSNMQWHDTLQSSVTQAKILDTIYIGKEYLINDPAYNEDYTQVFLKGDNDAPLKAKQILEELLQVFGLRILLSEGSWHVQQVHKLESNTYTVGRYDYLGAYTSSTTYTPKLTENGGTLAVLANGKFGYYPPVKIARAKIYPDTILKGNYGLWPVINKDNLTFTSSVFNLGTIYGGSNLALQININYNVRSCTISTTDFYIEVEVIFKAGTHRINNTLGGTVYDEVNAVWTTTAADTYVRNLSNIIWNNGGLTNMKNVGKVLIIQPSEDIPFASESNCTLQVIITMKSVSGSTNWPDVNAFNIAFEDINIGLYDMAKDPPVYAQVTQLEKTSTTLAANSIDIDYGLLKIADNLGTTTQASFNTIMVEQPAEGGTQKGSTTWVAGFPSAEDLVNTILKETLSLQNTAIKRYSGSFRSTIYNAWNTILYDSTIWAFMGGRYTSKTDEFNGEWFGIARDISNNFTNTQRANSVKDTNWKPLIPTGEVDTSRSLPQGPTHLAKITAKQDSGDTVTVLDIDTIYSHGKKGDQMIILNPIYMDKIQTVTLDQDIEAGQTTVNIVSTTAVDDLWQSQILAHEPRENVVSNNGRFTNLQVGQGSHYYCHEWLLRAATGTATPKEATTDGASATTSNTILVGDDCSLGCLLILTAKKQNTSDCAVMMRQFVITNDSGTTSISAIETIGVDTISPALSGISVAVTDYDAENRLRVTVTGLAITTIGWTISIKGVNIYH